MKMILSLLFLSSVALGESFQSRRGGLIPPENPTGEELYAGFFSDLKLNSVALRKVKFYLLNGDFNLAKIHLIKLTHVDTKLRPTIYRYLAIVAFIEKDFEKAHFYLSKPELQNIPYFSKICTMKVLVHMVLNQAEQMQSEWGRCQVENALHLKEENLVWMETLVDLKLQQEGRPLRVPFRQLKLSAYENEELKVLMKLALYLNQENLVVKEVALLSPTQLQDPEVRELAGQFLFRTGAFMNAYKFIEDLSSPNAENIKGNLYILRKKYELAFAQFKLALKEKQNSQNAMERLLPLAWLLGDWEGGEKFSKDVIPTGRTKYSKLVVESIFLTQREKYVEATKVLDQISSKSNKGLNRDVTQVQSFAYLMQNKTDEAKKGARLSCAQYDLINCWVLFELSQWETFPLMLKREDPLTEKREWEALMNASTVSELKETVYINQLAIEELDDKLILLTPNPTP